MLQRFGLSYFVVASVEAFLMPREYPPADQRGLFNQLTAYSPEIEAIWQRLLIRHLNFRQDPGPVCENGPHLDSASDPDPT